MNAYIKMAMVLLTLCFSPAIVPAQEQSAAIIDSVANDTIDGSGISRDLEEIVVKADAVIRDGNIIKAYPSKRDRNMTPDIVGVLANMSLPEIVVNPMGGPVKTIGGETVEIFVDFMPVSGDDLKSIRPQDVERIDIIRNPEDPRFQGKPVVANYIMKKYEYGGYTRLHTEQNVFIYSGDLTAFSRMTYKRMTYDLTAGSYYYNCNSRKGTEGEFKYLFPDLELTKKSTLSCSHADLSNPRVRFRAAYNHGGTSISNDIGFSYVKNDGFSEGETEYSDLYGREKYRTTSDYSIRRLYWNGNYSFQLPNDFALYLNGNSNWVLNNDRSEYASGNNPVIINDNSENRFSINGGVNAGKQFGKFSVGAGTQIEWEQDRIDYRSVMNRTVTNTSLSVKPEVYFGLPFGKLEVWPYAYGYWRQQRVNDYADARWSGGVRLPMSFNLGRRQFLYFNPQYDMTAPSVANLSPVIVRRTLTDAVCGNERLGYIGCFSAEAAYSYSFGPWLTAAVNVIARHYMSPVIPVYAPGATPSLRNVMIQSFENNGTMTRIGANMSLRGNYLNNRLQVYLWAYGGKAIRTGLYARQLWMSKFYASVTYNIRNFRISAFYYTPYKDFTPVADYMHSTSYGLYGSWGWKDLYVEAGAYNMFGKSGIESTSVWYGDSYSGTETMLGSLKSTPWIYFKITYSFSYGKKTDRSDELKELEKGTGNFLK